VCNGASVLIREDRQFIRMTAKEAAGPFARQEKQNRRARDGLIIFVHNFDDRLSRRALTDVVRRALAFDNYDAQHHPTRSGSSERAVHGENVYDKNRDQNSADESFESRMRSHGLTSKLFEICWNGGTITMRGELPLSS